MQAEADAIVAEATTDHGALVEAGSRAPAGCHGPTTGRSGCSSRAHRDARGRPVRDGPRDRHRRPPRASAPVQVCRPRGAAGSPGARVTAAGSWPRPASRTCSSPTRPRRRLMRRRRDRCVLVPADRVAANGDVAAAIGTYPMAVSPPLAGGAGHRLRAASRIDPATPTAPPIRSRSARRRARRSGASSHRPGRRSASRARRHPGRADHRDVTEAGVGTASLTSSRLADARARRAAASPPARRGGGRPSEPRTPEVRLMASVAAGARGALAVRTISDRALLRDVPRERPALRRLRALRPRGPRVRRGPLGWRVRAATRWSPSCSSTPG